MPAATRIVRRADAATTSRQRQCTGDALSHDRERSAQGPAAIYLATRSFWPGRTGRGRGRLSRCAKRLASRK